MKVKTFAAQYELIEFNYYVDHKSEKFTNVIDIVIESNNINFIEKEFNSLFIIKTDDNDSYMFSNYELIEYYEIGDKLIRIICVK